MTPPRLLGFRVYGLGFSWVWMDGKADGSCYIILGAGFGVGGLGLKSGSLSK